MDESRSSGESYKTSATEFREERWGVAGGPSSKTWPRCDSDPLRKLSRPCRGWQTCSVSQNVAGIANRGFYVILLVVFLCLIEFHGFSDIGRDRPIEISRLFPPPFYQLRVRF